MQIPLFSWNFCRNAGIYCLLYLILNHLEDCIAHAVSVQYRHTLLVNNLSLIIVNLIILKKILTDSIVVILDLFLCLFDC